MMKHSHTKNMWILKRWLLIWRQCSSEIRHSSSGLGSWNARRRKNTYNKARKVFGILRRMVMAYVVVAYAFMAYAGITYM